jgi:hypothetical protein
VDQLVVLMEPAPPRVPPADRHVVGRIAYATAVATTLDDCRAALDAAEKALVWSALETDKAIVTEAP